MDLFVKKRK